jgi:hypothetical protein
MSLPYSNPALPAAPGYALYSLPVFLGAGVGSAGLRAFTLGA